jgi:hypothetical protein
LTSLQGREDGFGSGVHGARRDASGLQPRGGNMLELINILRHGLPLSEPRTWLFIAAFVASGVAGWCSLDVIEYFKNNKPEA